MARVLRANAPLLLAFHIGHETMAIDELWGQRIEMDFVLFDPSEICTELAAVGLAIEEVVERETYPEVEYPSRGAYVFAHNKGYTNSARLAWQIGGIASILCLQNWRFR
jgi:hypothetical protein